MSTQSDINFANLPPVLQRLLRWMNVPLEQRTRGDLIFPFVSELAAEFTRLGARDVEITPHGALFATIPATGGCGEGPKLGFLASFGDFVDDRPHLPGWRLVTFHGGDIVVNREKDVILNMSRYPELARGLGHDFLVSDGAAPLNLKHRAGIALMLGILEHHHRHPEHPHTEIRLAVTPESLISHGEKFFDLERFGADYAYELTAPGYGHVVTECFNAARAVVTIRGRDCFPGAAKGRMLNAIRLMRHFLEDMPRDETPERTEDQEGFFHVAHIEGSVAMARALILIRDFGFDSFEVRKSQLTAMSQDFEKYGRGTCTVDIIDEYENMGRIMSRSSRVVKEAMHACRAKGISPEAVSVRGTMDGARLTSRGLPCPGLFTGAQFIEEGPLFEVLPTTSLDKAQSVVLEIVRTSANLKSLA